MEIIKEVIRNKWIWIALAVVLTTTVIFQPDLLWDIWEWFAYE